MADNNQIQSAVPDAVQATTEVVRIRKNGAIESDKLNDFIESATEDLVELVAQGNTTVQFTRNVTHTLLQEAHSARQRALALEEAQSFDRRMRALRGERVSHWVDLHQGADLSFVSGATESRRAAISTQYGEATIPMNGVLPKTYSLRLTAGGVVPHLNIVTTTGSFDKLLGDGVTDYEQAPLLIEETSPEHSVNGNNILYWRRRAVFDLESDVSEVECEVTIQLEDQANLSANVLYLHPYPLGNVDITDIQISPDLTDSYSPLPGFSETRGAGKRRWHFPDQKVAKIKIRLRQRNWIEDNGRKVFEYGLQEAGLQLVEWDQHYDSGASSLKDNHAFVARLDAEEGFLFDKLYGFYSTPDYTDEPAENRHLHFIVSSDAAGANVLWNSDLSSEPQLLGAPIELGQHSTIYVITTLNWAADVGVGSPFTAGTPPYVHGFGLDVSYSRSA